MPKFTEKDIAIFDTPYLSQADNHIWCHLTANSIPYLHHIARKLGLKQAWFQNKQGQPHYDIKSPKLRDKALSLGVKQVTRKEFFITITEWYPNHNPNLNPLDLLIKPNQEFLETKNCRYY